MAVRAGRRPGGAALQSEVIDLSGFVESKLKEGRLRSAMEAMCNAAIRHEKEVEAALATAGTEGQEFEMRMKNYARVRLALAEGGGEVAGADAAARVAVVSSEVEANAARIAGEDTSLAVAICDAQAPSFVAPPSHGVDIPLLLDAARCELGSAGAALLTSSVLGHRALRRLVYLDLSFNAITDLGLEFKGLTALLRSLPSLPALSFLSLAGNALLEQGGALVADALLACPALTHVDLSRCSLNPGGASALSKAFPLAPATSAPAAASAPGAGSAGAATEGAGAAAGGAAPGPAAPSDADFAAELAALLAEAGVTPAGDSAPAPAPSVARGNTTLRWLDLSDNGLGGAGSKGAAAGTLVEALMCHPRLAHLALGGNALGESASTAAAIARGLSRNGGALRSLGLEENGLGARAAADIAAAASGNAACALSRLSLRGNRIGSDGAAGVAELLRAQAPSGGPLTLVDLRGNYIQGPGREEVRAAMEGKPSPATEAEAAAAAAGAARVPVVASEGEGAGAGAAPAPEDAASSAAPEDAGLTVDVPAEGSAAASAGGACAPPSPLDGPLEAMSPTRLGGSALRAAKALRRAEETVAAEEAVAAPEETVAAPAAMVQEVVLPPLLSGAASGATPRGPLSSAGAELMCTPRDVAGGVAGEVLFRDAKGRVALL